MKLTADNKKFLWILIIALISLILASNAFAGGLKVIHEKTFNVKPGEKLELDAYCGDIVINTWDKNELYVKVFGNNRAEDNIDFEFVKTSSGVRITAEREGSIFFNWFSSINLRFEINMPKEFDVEVETSGGDISAKNLKGKMTYKTSGGDVALNSTSGQLLIKTSGGDIDLTNHIGESEAQTSGGNIKCMNTKGDLYVRTSGGSIQLKAVDGKINAHTSGGDIELDYSGVNRGVELTTSGGDIDVFLPSDFKAEVELRTSGGSIETEFTTTKTYKIKSYLFEAEFNGGGNKLYCKTSGGDVTVKEK